uniref:Carboxypeptidase n=1 Tax=Panagrolaimus sp. JU765 TaxID=591449 RepID=A0AC34RS62_9BILA
MLLKTLFLFFAAIYSAICCADADEIKYLPGLNFTINFKHYSGYLKTTNGKSLFYWFVESQKNPAKDPLIFWFNGGPGCSSTAEENYLAMKQFFKKHPKFRNHSTFIIGESYGGIFVPTLASKIIDGSSSFPIKLEGIGIGNGLLDYGRFLIDTIEFAYSHGVLDEDVYNSYRNACCQGCSDNCQLDGGETFDCISAQNYAYRAFQSSGLNLYDIYRECAMASSKLMMTELKPMFSKFSHLKMKNSGKEGKRSKRDVPCFDDDRLEKYLDNPQVRKALHVPDYVPQNWEVC